MGFSEKIPNENTADSQGVTNKVGYWNTAKGVVGKIWEGAKNAASKTGNFIYNNSDVVGGAVGGALMGTAGYFGGPLASEAARDGLTHFAKAIPEGKMKDALLSAAWRKYKNDYTTPNVDLTTEPGGVNHAENVSSVNSSNAATRNYSNAATGNDFSGVTGHYNQSVQTPSSSGYDPMFMSNVSSPSDPLKAAPNVRSFSVHPTYTGKYTHKNNSKYNNWNKIKWPKKDNPKTTPANKDKPKTTPANKAKPKTTSVNKIQTITTNIKPKNLKKK